MRLIDNLLADVKSFLKPRVMLSLQRIDKTASKCKPCRKSMPLFTEKRPSYWYMRSDYKPEAVVRSTLVCNGDSYIRKATSILVNHLMSLIIKKNNI